MRSHKDCNYAPRERMLYVGAVFHDSRYDALSRCIGIVSPRFTHVIVGDSTGLVAHVAPVLLQRKLCWADDVAGERTIEWFAVRVAYEIDIDARDLRGWSCVDAARRSLARRGVPTPWCVTPDQLVRHLQKHHERHIQAVQDTHAGEAAR